MRMALRCLALSGCLLMVTGCSSEKIEPAAAPEGTTSPAKEAKRPESRRLSREEQKHPKVVVATNQGKFTLQLDAEKAPITVANFLEYVDRGFYDGTVFHQVSAGYVVQGGGYDEKFAEKSAGPAIRNEAHNGLSNRRGTISMARAADLIDSSTSQFFINLGDNNALDHQSAEADGYGYCVFGQVIEGLETVDQIGNSPADAGRPNTAVRIESMRRLR
ncbi:MAG: peptidylprolyl isomerase [Pirellulales bacterium]|nr:peptidylprolyl isomerase [Pirellulales bacterium]